ncbi:MAG: type I secretion protein [Sediminimonas qiaohouensis]|uniref:Type I secretion protein n=1 Tax=Sediminimonas qiaohouensis TaxID=552061 RepID=A0A7C9HL86_9RHOB|nr:Hint domain-containing protein [Sediminimonas qiaohouensis]MTJ04268.1 type I secretion protein [Sediminimonas qiaohouensis]
MANLILDWSLFGSYGSSLNGGETVDTGGVSVTLDFEAQDEGATATTDDTSQYTAWGDPYDTNSSLALYGAGGEGGVDATSTTTLSFSSTDSAYADEVSNVSFRINDIDRGTYEDNHTDIVTVLAYDADGNAVDVSFTTSGGQSIDGNTLTGEVMDFGSLDSSDPLGSVQVDIAGPVAKIEIQYANGEETDQQISLTDVHFETMEASDAPDGYVEGTNAGDLIDATYTGDPDGDMIDAGDAVLPGEGPDDDIVLAGDGNDTVKAGAGDDEVYAGGGSDYVEGGAGDDVIHGDGDPAGGGGDTTETSRESFNWSGLDDPDCPDFSIGDGDDLDGKTLVQDTGTVTVTATLQAADTSRVDSDYDTAYINVDGIDGGDETVNDRSSLRSYDNDGNGDATYSFDFSEAVTNAQFTVSDIDGNLGQVSVRAFDADGNQISVNLTAGADLILSDEDSVAGDETATGSDNGPPTDGDNAVLVDIAGPVSRIEIDHVNVGDGASQVNISDIFFDADGGELGGGTAGDDTLIGGDGSDVVYGGDGNDVIDTGAPASSDPLPDLGYPGLFPADPDPDNDRDSVEGGAGNDTITTGDDADTISGGAGDDHIDGGIDADQISGDAGHDTIIGGEGSDTIEGGTGDDLIYGGLDPIYPDSLNISDDVDLVPDNGRDLIDGGDGNDTIYGQDDDDTITGGAGDDVIDAGIDDDTVDGGTGDDTVTGGHGDDTITGGDGADVLSGGDDRDTFLGATAGDHIDGGSGGHDYDTLDLTGSAPAGGSLSVVYDPNPENGTVNFFDGDGILTGSATFEEIENVIPCFTPGTAIATPQGERLVEDLKVGDRVITRDNGLQEIRWIGTKPLSGVEMARLPHLKPVLIKSGALGNGLPERDMMVSPNHRLLINSDRSALFFEEREVLAAAKHLVGSDGIHEVDVLSTSYIHFMFDHHEVVLSNGAWTESFQPGDLSLKGVGDAQRDEILELFPDLANDAGIRDYRAARRSLKKHEAKLLVK